MAVAQAVSGRADRVRRPAVLGAAAVTAAAVIVLVLDVYTLDWPLSPATRTISEYVFGRLRWPFYASALLLAGGSLLVLTAAMRSGLARWGSAASVAMLVWCFGLVAVVFFEKHDWSVGPSISGYVHQAGSLAAFLAMPIAGLSLGRAARGDG
ncbi:DUF998 domain-containing protein, partial [Stackebrandtia soli]|uniref:DUF998 domain-containing protein n=1 Tax=Stackebrandtia soli TaxID=1892856 RepID=UPI0039E74FE7